jgi:ferredoxin-NADP reductase
MNAACEFRGRSVASGINAKEWTMRRAMTNPAEPAPASICKLVTRDEVAEGTHAFHFDKPPNWNFQAGQFLQLTLLDPGIRDNQGSKRTFSIATAPCEETLMVTTRIRNTGFKQALNALPLGSTVKIEGPGGDLALDGDDARDAVILAGGIGITPFRSIVYAASRDKLPRRIFLFYSNRRPEDAPFLEELETLQAVNPNYMFIPTMTQMAKSRLPWHGEIGVIDKEMLGTYLQDIVTPLYYIAGPPEMVYGMRAMASQAGVAESKIRTEEFEGY